MFKLIVAAILGLVSVVGYCTSRETNPVTGERQYVALTAEQEVALGIEAAPELSKQFGGLEPDQAMQNMVDQIGIKIVGKTIASDSPYKFDFHVLNDDETINAFALPGGQIFITTALLTKLKTEGQVAGVLGHEIAHVLARHSSEQLAKQNLTQGLAGAAVIATYDPQSGAGVNGAVAQAIGALIGMRFTRNDELEADKLGVTFISKAGYDPNSLIKVMEVLASASKEAPPEFFSTHPNPDNRVTKIKTAINEAFPNGVPQNLIK